ncbi:glucan 1,3-beta-glucosidase precursor [Byssothecium circinans]|uniref:glucan endo-1,6-beta-glucosidase n=1 Tax=Byssothecium circinans TaxID=147558 RepID=A0A6A5TVH1_9PLEO|nr:glucan 1,3-beta-glucosidase precursor [Byssothecium circinans]
MKAPTLLFVLSLATGIHAWLPEERDLSAFNRTSASVDKRVPQLPSNKIRGVNLGGWLISEPWMMGNDKFGEWGTMGCWYNENGADKRRCSEFDCVGALGQSQADKNFNDHYARWITVDDIQRIHDAGLNTIRIPIGYWSFRDVVDSSEKFPNMDLKYLDNVVAKAASLGMFIVMDLHGAPGSQKTDDAFTGQCLPEAWLPGFFTQPNYDRAKRWLDWMTRRIHNTPSYKATVGIIEVVNEPQTSRDHGGMPQQERDTLTQVYYPQALASVRAAEASLNIPVNERLHVQFMDSLWGAGSPRSNLPSDNGIVFDDHNYVGGAVEAGHPNPKQADYMWYTCYDDNRLSDNNTPKLVGEWSLTVNHESDPEFNWQNDNNAAFYKQWFIAQQRLYEQTNGWIFWTWKNQLNDPRWDYSYLVFKEWVPKDAAGLDASRRTDVCKNYFGNSDGRS